MKIEQFNRLLISGFDVSFNYGNTFYTISVGEINGVSLYFLGDENYEENSNFKNLEELNLYKIKGEKTIKEIVESLQENEIYY